MSHEWDISTLTKEEKELANELRSRHKLLPVVADILVQRGIDSPQHLRNYLEPKLSDLHDPFLMNDMHKAIKRINKAIGNKEKILIYGDYDVDGTTAVTLVYKYLRQVTANIDYYIPDRYAEGSGISTQGVDYAHRNGFTLIIALDCGIKAVNKVAYAASLGIDFIICDHHVPDDVLPTAVALLNAKLPDSTYPFDELSGCGVGFKLMQAFAISNGSDMRSLYDLLDLVAVSIAADIVPLVGENRILAYHGLRNLNQNPAIGLKGIIEVSGLRSKELDISDITFKIGPRINASGRMQSGRESVDLLLARTPKEAKAMSHHIDEYNNKRRELDREITHEAKNIVESFTDIEDRKVIIVYDPAWFKGVIGIVASRLSEKYNRPTIVLTDTTEGLVCGSARSSEGFDIYTCIESCKDILENFGGHPYAAGMTIKKSNLHKFIKMMNEKADSTFSMESFTPRHRVDAELSLKEITPMLRRQLKKMAPFGPGNEKPIFCTRGVVCVTPPRVMGRKKNHLKMVVSMPGEMPFFQAFAYNQSDALAALSKGQEFDILYNIEEHNSMGKKMVQLIIIDIHVPEQQ
ncbi:single-stranded-DNA-specific exonuclease RecJ [Porphyromonas cangingivalis]|uniref:Single-stranded-DNA-specific exonuclease RecJ n=1 Tax=Porphyromonas cangingivalis TaxID=36874 RepID=A0A099X1B9_PORCN|nr:single-stranded-DNA-specific exonuclease RecJ [Porphyromonas cangingivalis]KGL50235.1 recombinase RecJ [Porphyromonas cangingivalis]KGN80277.1 recombinase RecJ [Porphyromonas cangingivalis]SJZ32651.1 single-stranded-DNA-specific exonuclease [Porphyromonas cangingivalis]SPY36014.1 Single-stranded-DNA-specific exonuclease recJ [Porphyromonas cangingivalis]VEJ04650.1 Single-stranded-DNA-specific exonuclease recJ [Porphyromonas cangingivalis]